MLLKAVRELLSIKGNISAIQPTLVLSPRLLETPGAGLVIRQDDRTIMTRALRRMANDHTSQNWHCSPGKFEQFGALDLS